MGQVAAAGIQQVLQQGVQPQGVDCQLVQLGLGLLMTGLSGCGEGIQGTVVRPVPKDLGVTVKR